MEARKITIVSTKAQKKYVINSTAETLGQLKEELNQAGIDYTDMTFMEGLTKTEMQADDALLPKNVQRTNRQTGETYTTNELVFMLTNTEKKIKSGAISRHELYAEIKSLGLQDAVKRTFGKNFTQCKTEDLASLVAEATQTVTSKAEERTEKENCQCLDNIKKAIIKLCNALQDSSTLSLIKVVDIKNTLGGEEVPIKEESPYSDEEIEDMFKDRY